MSDRLVDTSTISAMLREDPIVERRLSQIPAVDRLFVSVVTHAEIRYGIERLPAGRRRQKLEDAFVAVRSRFGPWLEVSLAISDQWAVTKAALEGGGIILPDGDLWIASTALVHNLVLVSNDRHFALVPGLMTEYWPSQ